MTMRRCVLSCPSTHVKAMQEEGGGSFWATFGGGTNGAEVRHVGHVLLPVGLAD